VVAGARQGHTRDIKQNVAVSAFFLHAFLVWSCNVYVIKRQPIGTRLAVGWNGYGGVRLSCLGRKTIGENTSSMWRTASMIRLADASWRSPCS
jgi:hypothetical protein